MALLKVSNVNCELCRYDNAKYEALQIVAKCDGRDEVVLSDCLLLQHVLWQRPEHSDAIRKFIADRLAANHADGLDRESLILSGGF